MKSRSLRMLYGKALTVWTPIILNSESLGRSISAKKYREKFLRHLPHRLEMLSFLFIFLYLYEIFI